MIKGTELFYPCRSFPFKYTEREIYDNITDVYYTILINIVDTILVPDYHAPQKKLGCAHDMTMFSVHK